MLRTSLPGLALLLLLTVGLAPDAHAVPDEGAATLQPSEITLARPLRFGSRTDQLDTASDAMLESAAQLLARNPRVTIEVRCWTDPRGSEEYNLRLSQARAEAVRAALARRNVAASRIGARGMGEITSGLPGCVLARTDRRGAGTP